MKNVIIISLLLLFGCNQKDPKTMKIKCVVEECSEVPKISVHDDIRAKRWRVKSCERIFSAQKPYNVGDTIEITIVDYR
jgi:flagellar basal body L-ring protein FlgH